jgi:hypothetical protein
MNSTGELHCLLPILALAKAVQPDLHFVLVFTDRPTRARLAEDPIYPAILAELGAELIYARSLLRYVVAHRHRIRIIFKDFGATPAGSLATILRRLCPNASLVLFPHAYTLHSAREVAPMMTESLYTSEHYDRELIDVVLLNSELDVDPWLKKFPMEKIRVVGATGYTDWWAAILRCHGREELKSVLEAAGDKKIVFLTTRGPHEVYLTEENYRYLVVQSLEVILRRPDVLIVLKPHPREDIGQLMALIAGYPQDRVKLTALNTLTLASISTVTVSFWSSALLDSLAVGTPSIEFYRYHQAIAYTVLDADGKVASLYTTLGLSLRADTRETLSDALDTALSQRAALLQRQRAAFDRCFPANEAQLDALRGLLGDLLRAPGRRTSAGGIARGLLHIARRSAGDLLQELRERRHEN